MSFIVSTENLSKQYGERTVVRNLNLRIPTGSIYGFLGPNGSGKSTTMKMLLSLIRPTSGQVSIMGEVMNRQSRRHLLAHIGSLIESPPGYGHLTGAENMRIVQRMLALNNDQVLHAIRTVRLEAHLDKKVRNYSLGMKQRLGIAMALAREPQLLILDEPTNGLDPAGIEEMRGLLAHLARQGVTVMVSSHLLGEIDQVATVLGIVAGGAMIFQGSRDDLFTATTPDILIRCAYPVQAQQLISGSYRSTLVNEQLVKVSDIDDPSTAELVKYLVSHGIDLYEVQREQQTLEDAFMRLTQGGGL